MGKIKKSARKVMARGRDAAVRVGKVAKSAAVAGVKAGASAAIVAGTLEAERSWKETSPLVGRGYAEAHAGPESSAMLAGAAVLGIAGVAIARSRAQGLD